MQVPQAEKNFDLLYFLDLYRDSTVLDSSFSSSGCVFAESWF